MNNKEVFILGSGFSKAFNPEMPTINNLLEEIEHSIGISDIKSDFDWEYYDLNIKYKGIFNFEEIMSLLSQDFPWKSEVENYKLKSLYSIFVNNLIKVLKYTQITTDYSNNFLQKFIHYILEKKSDLITFNYDTILENATFPILGSTANYNDFYKLPLVRLGDRIGTLWGSSSPGYPKGTYTLYKLHGSINWYYLGSKFGNPQQMFLEEGRESMEEEEQIAKKDLFPFIIPPLFEKTSFMNMNTVNVLWQEAKEKIAKADKIIIIGYSVPESDLNVKLMLKNSINDKKEIIIVNNDLNIKLRIENMFNGKIAFNDIYIKNDEKIIFNYIEEELRG